MFQSKNQGAIAFIAGFILITILRGLLWLVIGIILMLVGGIHLYQQHTPKVQRSRKVR